MRVTSRLLASLVFGSVLLIGTPAHAETIHTPTDNTSVQEDQAVRFDWAWDSDQYASRINFTQNPDPNADVWFNGTAPAKIRVTDDGYPFTSSNATVIPNRVGLTPGQWYWRLCSFSINGEDDKCYQRDTPHPITITAAPAPPPPVVAPVPAPTTPAAPTPEPPRVPAKPYSRTSATGYAKLAIDYEFSYKKTPAKRRVRCATPVKGINRCAASWETGRYRYRGTVRISSNPFTAGDLALVKDNPTELDTTDYWYGMKLTRTTKKTGSKKTITVG